MEDDSIVNLYWERSENAISETSKKYGNYCYSIAYGILGNIEDADESVNDTYLDAWNSIPPHPSLFGSSFVVLIMDYQPRTNKPIYSFEDLREYLETKDDNEIFHFAYENVYIGVSPDDLSAEEILDVVNSIP